MRTFFVVFDRKGVESGEVICNGVDGVVVEDDSDGDVDLRRKKRDFVESLRDEFGFDLLVWEEFICKSLTEKSMKFARSKSWRRKTEACCDDEVAWKTFLKE